MLRSVLATSPKSVVSGSERFFLGLLKSDLAQGALESKGSNMRIVYFDSAVSRNDVPGLFEAGVDFIASRQVRSLVKAAKEHGIQPLRPHYAARD
jgi:hypothetical protein